MSAPSSTPTPQTIITQQSKMYIYLENEFQNQNEFLMCMIKIME